MGNKELKNKLIKFAAMNNLNFVVRFHNVMRGMIRRALSELELENGTKTKQVGQSQYHRFDEAIQINAFLMLYSHVEEWLYLISKKTPTKPKGLSLGRFKPPLKALGVDLSCKAWELMMDSEKLRNCILHANGRVDLSRDKDVLEKIIAKYSDELKIVNQRLRIGPQYLERFATHIDQFLSDANR